MWIDTNPNFQYQWVGKEQSVAILESNRVFLSPDSATTYFFDITPLNSDVSVCNLIRQEIKVTVVSKAILELGNDIQTCQSEIILDAKNEGNQYEWSTGTNTQKITINQSGTYFVTVTTSCNEILSDSTEVNFIPSPSIDFEQDTIIVCNANDYTLSVQAEGYAVRWSDGSTNTDLFITSSGKYFVELSNPICTDVLSDSVVVVFVDIESPQLPDSISTCDTSVIVTAGQNPDLNYLWTDGYVGGERLINQSGWYRVNISSKLCPEKVISDSVFVEIYQQENTLDLGDEMQYVCVPLTLDAGTEGVKYKWLDGSENQTITVTQDGVYSVILEDECGNIQTDTTEVFFFGNTLVNFTMNYQGNQVEFIPFISSTHDVDIHWLIDGEPRFERQFSQGFRCAGIYEVSLLVSSQNCDSDPIKISKNVEVTFPEITNFTQVDLVVYPNPASNYLVINRCNTAEEMQITLYDAIGKELMTSVLASGKNDTTFSIDFLVKGHYLLKTQTSSHTQVHKIMKE